MTQISDKVRNACVGVAVTAVMGSNVFNYFYAYQYAQNIELQWRVAMIAIATALLAMSIYIFVTEKRRGTKYTSIATGWMTLFLFANLVGVLGGYNLHTKGLMMILFLTITFGIIHIFATLWRKYL